MQPFGSPSPTSAPELSSTFGARPPSAFPHDHMAASGAASPHAQPYKPIEFPPAASPHSPFGQPPLQHPAMAPPQPYSPTAAHASRGPSNMAGSSGYGSGTADYGSPHASSSPSYHSYHASSFSPLSTKESAHGNFAPYASSTGAPQRCAGDGPGAA